jgi:hypothetical protein
VFTWCCVGECAGVPGVNGDAVLEPGDGGCMLVAVPAVGGTGEDDNGTFLYHLVLWSYNK